MTARFLTSAAALAFSAAGITGVATAQEIVRIDGSSTVFPISEAFAEEFQNETGNRVTVGLSGTGGGFQKFCRGETDISGASRPIKEEEIAFCAENNIEYIELPVALDALANIVNPNNDWVECLTVAELKKIWEPAAQGTITNWNQVRAEFPDRPLELFGAGTDSGTYDYYTQALVGEEGSSRGDYTATEDDNITIQGVSGSENALGFLGLAYVTENQGRVKPIAVENEAGECVTPSVETARNATYQPLSRPLFFYVAVRSADKPNVKQFLEYNFDPARAEELVGEVGYVPLLTEIHTAALEKFEAKKTGTAFGEGSQIGVKIEDLVRLEQ